MPRDGTSRSGAKLTEDKFSALIRLFMSPANAKWANPPPLGYTEGTREMYERELRDLGAVLGERSRFELKPSIVQGYFDGISDRPGKQQNALSVLRTMEAWAIVRDLLPRQISLGIEIGRSDGGHIPWTDEQVALGEQRAHPDLARAVTLVANTGQRGSDLIRMGWTDIETYQGIDGIKVRQKKTGRLVWIPITAELAAAMRGWDRTPGPFLTNEGARWTRAQLTNAWGHERDKNARLSPLRFMPEDPVPGLTYLVLDHGENPGKDAGLVLHGLRGTACVRLRRAGATESEISAMVGMSIDMVARYCRFALQRESAAAAAAKLDRTFAERLAAKRDTTTS